MSKNKIDTYLKIVGDDVKYFPEYFEGWDPEGNSDVEVAFHVEWKSTIYELSLLEHTCVGGGDRRAGAALPRLQGLLK